MPALGVNLSMQNDPQRYKIEVGQDGAKFNSNHCLRGSQLSFTWKFFNDSLIQSGIWFQATEPAYAYWCWTSWCHPQRPHQWMKIGHLAQQPQTVIQYPKYNPIEALCSTIREFYVQLRRFASYTNRTSFILTVCVQSVPLYCFKLAYVVLHMAVKEFLKTHF